MPERSRRVQGQDECSAVVVPWRLFPRRVQPGIRVAGHGTEKGGVCLVAWSTVKVDQCGPIVNRTKVTVRKWPMAHGPSPTTRSLTTIKIGRDDRGTRDGDLGACGALLLFHQQRTVRGALPTHGEHHGGKDAVEVLGRTHTNLQFRSRLKEADIHILRLGRAVNKHHRCREREFLADLTWHERREWKRRLRFVLMALSPIRGIDEVQVRKVRRTLAGVRCRMDRNCTPGNQNVHETQLAGV